MHSDRSYVPGSLLLGGTAHHTFPLERRVQQDDFTKTLSEMIGKTVCVCWATDREKLCHSFEPKISVQGKLEGDTECSSFRVFVSNNTYSYFSSDYVWCIGYAGAYYLKFPVIFIDD